MATSLQAVVSIPGALLSAILAVTMSLWGGLPSQAQDDAVLAAEEAADAGGRAQQSRHRARARGDRAPKLHDVHLGFDKSTGESLPDPSVQASPTRSIGLLPRR